MCITLNECVCSLRLKMERDGVIFSGDYRNSIDYFSYGKKKKKIQICVILVNKLQSCFIGCPVIR